MTKETLTHALNRLARSKNIAKRLLKEKCHGTIFDLCKCPVANWLKLQGFKDVSVGVLYISNWSNVSYTIMPKKVIKFIRKFDAGGYKKLHLIVK